MIDAELNYLAIVVVALISVGIATIWYLPAIFGKTWLALIGKRQKDLAENTAIGYLVATAALIVIMYVLSQVIFLAEATTPLEGATTAFWLWLGFTAATTAINYVFAGWERRLWLIDSGYFLTIMVIGGVILAVWR
jgi:hypothetical protein